ncbi:integrase core domain-containing protein [Acidithiobacillus sp.]
MERINGSWRHEFYHDYDLPPPLHQLRPLIKSWQPIYNTIRPHSTVPTALAASNPAGDNPHIRRPDGLSLKGIEPGHRARTHR